MDKDVFVRNVQRYCDIRGIKPTVACRESGAGANFFNNVKNANSIPSVDKVQRLASYLGVTTSQLLGEEVSDKKDDLNTISDEEAALDRELITRLCQLTPEQFARVDAFVQGMLSSD